MVLQKLIQNIILALVAASGYAFLWRRMQDLSYPTLDLEKFRDPKGTLRVLVIYPHPDDETMMVGGLMAKLCKNIEFRVVTLTRGEAYQVNTSYDPDKLDDIRHSRIKKQMKHDGEVRTIEWHKALKFLGLDPGKSALLDFPDGGIEQNRDKVRQLVQTEFDTFDPQVVITYDASGLYGHPDHIVLSEIVTELADKERRQIIYNTMPAKILRRLNLPYHMSRDRKPVLPIKPTHCFSFRRNALAVLLAIRAHKSQKLMNHKSQIQFFLLGGMEYFHVKPKK